MQWYLVYDGTTYSLVSSDEKGAKLIKRKEGVKAVYRLDPDRFRCIHFGDVSLTHFMKINIDNLESEKV